MNYFSGNVALIDTRTNMVTAEVPGWGGPHALATTPDGAFLYVTNRLRPTGPGGLGAVSVIDTATNMSKVTIPIGLVASPAGRIAITPDGAFAYVTNALTNAGRPGAVTVIATTTNTVARVIPVGSLPSGIAIAPARSNSPTPSPVPSTRAADIAKARDGCSILPGERSQGHGTLLLALPLLLPLRRRLRRRARWSAAPGGSERRHRGRSTPIRSPSFSRHQLPSAGMKGAGDKNFAES